MASTDEALPDGVWGLMPYTEDNLYWFSNMLCFLGSHLLICPPIPNDWNIILTDSKQNF